MENSIANDLQKNGQSLADKAADKAQGGIRDAKQATKEAGAAFSDKIDQLRQNVAPAVNKAIGRTRDAASEASDSLIAYTRENPVKALLIAAASGALLLSLINVLKSTRD
jgi:ElaB/YqjD/DUF883 family membrane-anchored ribosome-binding protein